LLDWAEATIAETGKPRSTRALREEILRRRLERMKIARAAEETREVIVEVVRAPDEKPRVIIAKDECAFDAYERKVRAEKPGALVLDFPAGRTAVQQKADEYFAQQERRLGPIAPISRKQHIADGIASLRAASASSAKADVHNLAIEIDALIQRATKRMETACSD
jgi:hypothetical protein